MHATSSEKPAIAVYGLMNAGKSFLLNMLTQNVKTEYFKTADQRETSAVKRLETADYIYLDTPGLDANEQDDLSANQGVADADIVLFVHQPQGELEFVEVEFLRRLKDNFGTAARTSIIIVISKIDKESQDKIDLIRQKIESQCQAELGFAPTTLTVSNTRYKAGVEKNQAGLIQASHIDDVAAHLGKLVPKVRKARTQRVTARVEALQEEVAALLQELRSERTSIRTRISDRFSTFSEQMNHLQDFLNESKSNYERI